MKPKTKDQAPAERDHFHDAWQEMESANQLSLAFTELMLAYHFVLANESWGVDGDVSVGLEKLAVEIRCKQRGALERLSKGHYTDMSNLCEQAKGNRQ